MAEHQSQHEQHEHSHTGTFVAVFVGLLILTAASFAVFRIFHESPAASWIMMMAISCMKASLVISIFMHLKWEANWKYVLTLPCIFMSIFLTLMLVPDVGWRLDSVSHARRVYMAEPPGDQVHPFDEHGGEGHEHGQDGHAADDRPHSDHNEGHGDEHAEDGHGKSAAHGEADGQ